MKLVKFNVLPYGLEILLTPEGKAETLENPPTPQELLTDNYFLDLCEWQLCNGWELIRPEEVGALTDSLIFSETAVRDDWGELKSIGAVYWFPDYQILAPAKELLTKGRVFFPKGEEYV